MDDRRRA
jgi:hypothetical protein